MKILIVSIVSLVSALLMSCGSKSSSTSPSLDLGDGGGGGAGAVTLPTTMLGRKVRCGTFTAAQGTTLNGKKFGNVFEMSANGTYSYSVNYSDATTCVSNLFPAGGEDVFRYDQQGTYTVSALNGDGSYSVTFTITAEQFTSRTGTMGVQMRNAVNTNCFPSPNLSGGSTTSITGITCGSIDGAFIVPSTPLIGAVSYQRFLPSGSNFTAAAASDEYHFGNASAPASASVNWYDYP